MSTVKGLGMSEQKQIIKEKIIETLKNANESIPSDFWLESAIDIFYKWKRKNRVFTSDVKLHIETRYDSFMNERNIMILSEDNKSGIAIRRIESRVSFDEMAYNIEGRILARQERSCE